ncbi:transposase [Shimia sp. R10_1]|nr:transposase [Shimia sp. R10_1]
MLQAHRSTYHYKAHGDEQAELKNRIKEIAETRVRYDYRRILVLLRREGWVVNAKRVYRLYNQMGLQLRNKTPQPRVKAKLREDRVAATQSKAKQCKAMQCNAMRLGQWTLCTINWSRVAKSAC